MTYMTQYVSGIRLGDELSGVAGRHKVLLGEANARQLLP